MPIVAISLGKADREGFEFDYDIPTVFERFEIVWPLDIGDSSSEQKSSRMATDPTAAHGWQATGGSVKQLQPEG
jgi:hypothetical protein